MKKIRIWSFLATVMLSVLFAAAASASEKKEGAALGVDSPLYQDWLQHSGAMLNKLSQAEHYLQRLMAVEAYQIANVVLGNYGEVLLNSPGKARNFGAADTWAVLQNGKLAVLSYVDDKPVPLLLLDKDLRMLPTVHCPEQFIKSYKPRKWPAVDKAGHALRVGGVHILLPKSYSRREMRQWQRSKPAVCEGAFFLDIWGNMRGLCENEPFPNVLWIARRADGGLDFLHAGPEMNGTFIEVMPDGLVHFVDPEAKSWTGSKEGVHWTVRKSKSKLPAIYNCNWRTLGTSNVETWVGDNGEPGWQIEIE